jgi:hypothetical protein
MPTELLGARHDTRTVTVSWNPTANAVDYLVRYGHRTEQALQWQSSLRGDVLYANSLDVGTDYYFTVDSFNDTSVGRGTLTVEASAQP